MLKQPKKLTREEVDHLAKAGRDKANKMTDSQREEALAMAMRLIYGNDHGKKAVCR